MVLYVLEHDIHPDKLEAFSKWVDSAVKRSLAVPGVVEFRSYRPITGTSQIASTWEFADMAARAAWQGNEDIKKLLSETHTLGLK